MVNALAVILLVVATEWIGWSDGVIVELHPERCSNADLVGFIKTNWELDEAFKSVTIKNDGTRINGCYARQIKEDGQEFIGVIDEKDGIRMKFIYPS